MPRRCLLAAMLLLCAAPWAVAADEPRGLDIWFIDVEGGAATLIVTPAGESVLIDCGNPGPRDAERIHKTATEHSAPIANAACSAGYPHRASSAGGTRMPIGCSRKGPESPHEPPQSGANHVLGGKRDSLALISE